MNPSLNKKDGFQQNRSIPASTFLLRNYIGLFLFTGLFTFSLVLILVIYQARTLNRVYASKSADVINLHRNELLNEIALSDFPSISQHLNFMLNEIGADQIVLYYNDQQLVSKSHQVNLSSIVTSIVKKIGGIYPFRVDVANEFANFHAVLEVTYVQSLFLWMLYPVFLSTFVIAGLSWLLVASVFVIIFRRIRNHFITPLNLVTASLLQRDSKAAESSPQAALVEEIVQLQRACLQYRAIESEAAFTKVARQVTHDIRSPLAALDTLLGLIQDLPEDQRVLLRTAVGRIRDLSNNLLTKTKGMAPSVDNSAGQTHLSSFRTSECLAELIESAISEKRQHPKRQAGTEIQFTRDPTNYDVFARIDSARMKRILSNLLDNALESIREGGYIEVSLIRDSEFVKLAIRDNGCGIPAAVLPTLMQRGQTYGKADGSGLGLAFARECVTDWGGEIWLKSVEGQGTTVFLQLPSAKPPDWFVSELRLKPDTSVVVIDDDPSIHEVWKQQFHGLSSSSIRLTHFTSLQALERFCQERREVHEPILYLCDFEFRGATENGIDALARLALTSSSILVTSRADEPSIRARCVKLEMGLLPKSAAPLVPIRVV